MAAVVEPAQPVPVPVPAIRIEVPDVKVSLADEDTKPAPQPTKITPKGKEKLTLVLKPTDTKEAASSSEEEAKAESSTSAQLPELARQRSNSSASTVSRTDTLPLYAPPSPVPCYESCIASPSLLSVPSPTLRRPADDARSITRPASPARSVISQAPTYRSRDENVKTRSDETTYHIYHIWEHFSLHTQPDRILEELPQYKRSKDGISEPTPYRPGHWKRFWLPIKKNGRRPDYAKTDPRMASYYMHKPHLIGGSAPSTLRVGPNRRAPVSCRVSHTKGWKRYMFDFTDVNGEGVINEKGLVTGQDVTYFTKEFWKKKKWLNGGMGEIDEGRVHNISNSETAKEKEKEPEQKITRKQSFAKKLLRINSCPASSSSSSKSPIEKPVLPARAMTMPVKLPETKPEDLVVMHCKPTRKSVRKYDMEYRGVKFHWKGTSTTKNARSKVWGPWCRYAHLKLVAELPGDGQPPAKEKSKKKRKEKAPATTKEVVLAVYTCVFGKRKAGYVTLKNKNIDEVLKYMESLKKSKPNTEPPSSPLPPSASPSSSPSRISLSSTAIASTTSPSSTSSTTSTAKPLNLVDLPPPLRPSKKKSAMVWPRPSEKKIPDAVRERNKMVELILASTICMLQQEKEKRDTIYELLQLIMDLAMIPC